MKSVEDEDTTVVDDDAVKARRNFARYKYGLDRGHSKYVKAVERNEAAYYDSPWDKDLKEQMNDDGIPALEMNMIFNIVELISGQQIESRNDTVFKPKPGGTQEVSEILTRLHAHTLEENDANTLLRSEIFQDGMIARRGFYDVTINFDDNDKGEVKLTTLNPVFVIPDPDGDQYDPSTWQDVVTISFMNLDEIEDEWGIEKAREVKAKYAHGAINAGDPTANSDTIARSSFSEDGGEDQTDAQSGYGYVDSKATGVRLYTVIRRQWYKRDEYPHFIYPKGDIRPVPLHMLDEKGNPTDKAFLKAREVGADIQTRRMKRIMLTISTEDILLFDDWSVYRYLTPVPYYPYFRRGVTRSMVDRLISPQMLLDKAISQELHIINTTANSGWLIEEDSIANMTVGEWEEKSGQTGFTGVYKKDIKNKPEKIHSNAVPTGLDRMVQYGLDMIKEISGASEAARGYSKPNESGIAIGKKQARFAVTLARAFLFLKHTDKLLAKRCLALYQDFYTDERVVMITKREIGDKPVFEEMTLNQVDEATGETINNLRLGEYGVVVSDAPPSDTFGEGQFQQAMDMRKAGVGIPDKTLVRLSTLSKKEEIVEDMEPPGPTEDQAQYERNLRDADLSLKQYQVAEAKAKATKAELEASRMATDISKDLVMSPGLGDVAQTIEDGAEEAVESTAGGGIEENMPPEPIPGDGIPVDDSSGISPDAPIY